MSTARAPVVNLVARSLPEGPALKLAPTAARFVGRVRELAELVAAVTSGARVCWVSGGAGTGKTALLGQLAARCRELALPYHWLAPHEAATPSVLCAIAEELARRAGPREARRVLVIDDFAVLRPIELWFFERYVLSLPASVSVVMADRVAPSPRGSDDGGLAVALALGPLAEADAERYLELRGVPDEQRAGVHAYAEGIPALLAAAAEAACGPVSMSGGPGLRDERLRFYTRHASHDQRLAIAVLVAARATPYELLELAFDNASAARDAFAWLSRLSVVEHSPLGLSPHPVLRKACERELAEHSAALWQRARRAVRVFADHRIAVAREPARWLLDRLYVDRQHPALREHMLLPAVEPALAVGVAGPGDRAAIMQLAAAQHRDRAVTAITSWIEDDRAVFDVLRDPGGLLRGYLCNVVITATSQSAGRDPGVALCVAHLETIGWFGLATPPDARALVCRDWTVAGALRAPSPGAALLLAQLACRLLTTPAVDFHFVVTDRAELWLAAQRALGLEPQVVGEQRLGGAVITAIVTDWRRRSVASLLQQLTDSAVPAELSLAVSCATGAPPPSPDSARELSVALHRRTTELARSAGLSRREHEVFELLLLGRNCAEIGVALKITARTARFHQHNVLAKVGAESRLDILRLLL